MPGHGDHHGGGREHAFAALQLGVGAGGAVTFEDGETGVEGGGEVIADFCVVNNVLEIGLGVGVLGGGEHPVVSADVLLEIPYHLDPLVEIYGGLGPLVNFVIGGTSRVGAKLAAGLHLWFDHTFGLTFEVSYGLLLNERVDHEIALLLAPSVEIPL